MASAVTHTDKTTTPLTYQNPITLLFTFVFTPYKKLFIYFALHLIRSYFFVYFRLYALQEVVLLILTNY